MPKTELEASSYMYHIKAVAFNHQYYILRKFQKCSIIHNHNVLTLFPMASESRSRRLPGLWGREEWDRGRMSTFTRHVSDV